ncbi:MAG: HK97 family phage prohead protease [Acidimicrobiales bacterium]
MSDLIRLSVELRSEVSGNTVIGHASVFNQLARIGQTYERMAPTAFDAVLASEDTDARALINHDANQVLGRQSAGTLRLRTDEEGLVFEVDLPNTTYANDLRELMARGDVTGASFGFVPGDAPWTTEHGVRVRTHTSVARLADVSVVTFPAYEGAGAQLRAIDLSRAAGESNATSNKSRLIRARHNYLTGGMK